MRALAVPAACLGLLLGVPAAPARADEASDARAKELFENGARLYEEGLYDEAVVAWQAAYQLSPKPLLLFNMANAYERLGRYQEAYDHLNRYRALAPAEERETLERRIANIERRIAEVRERANQGGSGVDPLLDASGSRITVTSSSSKAASAGPHPAGLALVVGGGVGVGVGALLDGLALRQRASATALCSDAVAGMLLCPDTAEPHIVKDRQLSVGGDVAMIVGGAALGAGVVVLVVDAVGGGGGQALRIVPSVGPGAAAVTLSGRF